MSDETFRRFRCWRTAEVQRTVQGDIGSLGTQDDAVFLAAHARVPLDRGVGTERLSGGEREILDSLTGDIGKKTGENTLIAVTGGVGTGKSHAVRWVRAHLEDDPLRYRTIYVPRDLTTLRSLLGRILDGLLPGEKVERAKRQLEGAIGAKPEAQLRDDLIFNIRQVLTFELPDQGPGNMNEDDREERTFLLGQRDDRSEPRRDGLAEILLAPQVMAHLGREDGTVAAVIQSVKAKRGGRDAMYPQFTSDDIPRQSGILGQFGPTVRDLWNSVRSNPRPAVALLNEALRRAVSMTIGFGSAGGVTLNDVFNETRRLLREEKIDLVLLFEDLAQFGLVDADLYDQFSQQPGDEYCPLRVVFAATDGKFRELPDTVQSRINHHFHVQNLALGNDDADSTMVTFVARYLNNARVGRDRLIEARVDATDRAREDGSWVPNKCTDCPHRDECFRGFGWADTGAAGIVGLYPHNETSLRRAFLHLREQNRLSPRSIINEVVRDFLNAADPEIEARVFPSKETGNWFQLRVSRPQDSIVAEREAPSPEERDRLRRVRIIWRDGEPENRGMQVAFDLPGALRTDRPPGSGTDAAGETPPGPTGTSAPSREQELLTRREQRMQSLYDWDNKVRELPEQEMTEFRNILRDWTLAKVDLGRHLVNAGPGTADAILTSIFPMTTFFIDNAPGVRPASGRLCFEILPAPHTGSRLLTAVRWFNDHGHWDAAAPDRAWEFPVHVKPASLQVELENFLGSCAAKVEERFLQEITSSTGVRPASAVVSLRTAALRALGGLNADDLAHIVNVAGGKLENLPGAWSPSWAALATPAQEIVRTLDASLIGEFAAAHQGSSATPIVIDAAALESAGRRAFEDPAGAVDRLGQFSDRLSEIALAKARLTVDWTQVMAAERQELLDELQFLRESTVTGDRDLANWADELGTRANADHVFRSAEGFPRFKEAIAFLRSIPRDKVHEWLAATEAISDPGNHAALLDAQSWSFYLRSYVTSARLVLEAMRATAREISSQITRQAGGNPQEIADHAADRFDATANLLDRLGWRTS